MDGVMIGFSLHIEPPSYFSVLPTGEYLLRRRIYKLYQNVQGVLAIRRVFP